MATQSDGHVIYTVKLAASGQWEVLQNGFSEAIASFRAKSDALEYAQRLAATKPSAEIVES